MVLFLYVGPTDAPLAPTAFEAFIKVPKFLRPHTQIYCTRYCRLVKIKCHLRIFFSSKKENLFKKTVEYFISFVFFLVMNFFFHLLINFFHLLIMII